MLNSIAFNSEMCRFSHRGLYALQHTIIDDAVSRNL